MPARFTYRLCLRVSLLAMYCRSRSELKFELQTEIPSIRETEHLLLPCGPAMLLNSIVVEEFNHGAH